MDDRGFSNRVTAVLRTVCLVDLCSQTADDARSYPESI